MAQQRGNLYTSPVTMVSRHRKNAPIADALDNSLIFITLLIALGLTIYILNRQLIRLV